MTTDSEARAVEKYLRSNPENLAVALAVYESWPAVRDHVCRRFLEQIRSRIEQNIKQRMPDCAHDIEVGCRYDGKQKGTNALWLFRSSWAQYHVQDSRTKGRTYIFLWADGREPINWYFGVSSPLSIDEMKETERDRRTNLDERLKIVLNLGGRTDWNPQWAYVSDRMRNWNDLVPNLGKECEAGGGEITDYFVDLVTDVAIRAIPAISEIEGEQV